MSGTRPLRGVMWMVLTGLLFVGVTATVKYGARGLPAVEAAFLRYGVGLVFVVPMLGQLRRPADPPRPGRCSPCAGAFTRWA